MSKREPLMDDKWIPGRAMVLYNTMQPDVDPVFAIASGMTEARNHYEDLIDKGELITKEEHLRLVREAENDARFRWSEP